MALLLANYYGSPQRLCPYICSDREAETQMPWPQGNERSRVKLPNYPQISEKKLLTDIRNFTRKMNKCFTDTNLDLFDGLSLQAARRSAASYVREFRKIIPLGFEQSRAHPISHCWKMNYEVHTKNWHIWGHIGDVKFDQIIPDDYRSHLLQDIP